MTAAQLGQTLQAGTKNAADTFSQFVEGDDRSAPRNNDAHNANAPQPDKRDFWESFGEAPKGPAPEKKDFWDSFAAAGDTAQTKAKPTSIGTSAMKKPVAGSQQASSSSTEDTWGDW